MANVRIAEVTFHNDARKLTLVLRLDGLLAAQ